MPEDTVPSQPHKKPGQTDEASHPSYRSLPHAPSDVGHSGRSSRQQPQRSPAIPERGAPSPTNRSRKRRRAPRSNEFGSLGEWIWVFFAVGVLGLAVLFSLGVFLVLSASRGEDSATFANGPVVEPTSAIFGIGGILDDPVSAGEPVGGLLGDEGQSMMIHSWDGQERFTILVMGMDRRPGEPGAAYRTDTMILISLDPVAKRVGILSVPRDLYVDVPGFGIQRINTAYGAGEQMQLGNGPRLAMQTVQYNFGIPVHEYAVVDFNAFIRVIDLLGGISVNVENPISDPLYPDMNYGYDPFYLAAGAQTLDGVTALKYARSRHGSDDIDRARRQQKVLYAVRDTVLARDMLPKLVLEAPMLWSELDAGIDTGLALDQIIQLAWWFSTIPPENFTNGVVGWEYVIPHNWQGQSILLPNRAQIAQLMVSVFGQDYNPYR